MLYQTQTARRLPKGPKRAVFVPDDLDLDIQTRPSEGPNIFHVNLAQIRSAVPEIFHTQTKKSQTTPKTEPYAVHGMW